jgi:4-amino-4-deoxychorismate lyase
VAIAINGALVEPKDASVSIFDRGFQYGDGLFETIAFIAGKPVFWEEHLRRMSNGAAMLGIPMPDREAWESDAALATANAPDRAVLKLTLTRGIGGRGYALPFPQLPTRIAYTTDWPQYPREHWERGIDVVTCRTTQLDGGTFATLKSLNRLNQVLARAELPANVPEGLLVDTAGMVREGTFTNLVWMRDGRAKTPRLTDTGIPGVMRGAIVSRLGLLRIPCDAVDVPPDAILESDECFACNSLIGVWPIRALDGRTLREAPGEITRDLLAWTAELGLGPQERVER